MTPWYFYLFLLRSQRIATEENVFPSLLGEAVIWSPLSGARGLEVGGGGGK